tara:strand:- start:2885 stop:3358 length:474 start_codon:yes stop_codon:yes gene_type:complete
MNYKRIDNFLPDELHQSIVNYPTPYYYRKGLSYEWDDGYAFGVCIFDLHNDFDTHLFNDLGMPLVSRLECTGLLHAKVNCYPRTAEPVMSSFHCDHEFDHMVGLYSVNTCNGYTEFEDGDTADSIANSMVIFDGKLKHRSVSQTDENIRVNININYL